MKYAIYLDEENRVTSATYEQFSASGAILVDSIPDGSLLDYKYYDGEYHYDPLPIEEVVEEKSLADEVAELKEQNEMLLECILELSTIIYE